MEDTSNTSNISNTSDTSNTSNTSNSSVPTFVSSVPTFVEVGRAQKRSSSNTSHPEIISDKFWKPLKQLTELASPLSRNFKSFNQVQQWHLIIRRRAKVSCCSYRTNFNEV